MYCTVHTVPSRPHLNPSPCPQRPKSETPHAKRGQTLQATCPSHKKHAPHQPTSHKKQDNNAELAQNLLNSSLRYNEKNIASTNLYGKMLRAAGYPEDALLMYGRTLASDPLDLEALISRANIYYRRQKRFYEAEWHLRLAMKFYSGNLFVLSTYAAFLADIKKDLDKSEKLYLKALDIMNKQVWLSFALCGGVEGGWREGKRGPALAGARDPFSLFVFPPPNKQQPFVCSL